MREKLHTFLRCTDLPNFKTLFRKELSETKHNSTNYICYHNQSSRPKSKPLDLNLSFPNMPFRNGILWVNDDRRKLNPRPARGGSVVLFLGFLLLVLGLSPKLQGPPSYSARNGLHNLSQDLWETQLSSTNYPLKNQRVFTN